MNLSKKIITSLLALVLTLSGASAAFATSSVSADASLKVRAGNTADQSRKNILYTDTTGSAELRTSESGKSNKSEDSRNFLRINGKGSTTVSSDALTKAKARANQEIDKRVDSLNKLQTRVNGMARLSAAVKASLSASIQSSITEMNNLKAKINADTDISVLKSDVASITASYRIYALVMPQATIAAAADRINTLVDMMTTIGEKFKTRIQAASDAGKNVTSLQVSLNDYNVKIADAKVQAQAATTLTASLSPDNGDQVKREANRKALTEARAKLKIARDDLKAAREDARNILKDLKAFGDVSLSASSSLKVK